MDEATPSFFDPSTLLRSQIFRANQNGQLVEATESSVDPMHSRHGKRVKHGLCEWHKVSFNDLMLHRLLTTQMMWTCRLSVDIRNPV